MLIRSSGIGLCMLVIGIVGFAAKGDDIAFTTAAFLIVVQVRVVRQLQKFHANLTTSVSSKSLSVLLLMLLWEKCPQVESEPRPSFSDARFTFAAISLRSSLTHV